MHATYDGVVGRCLLFVKFVAKICGGVMREIIYAREAQKSLARMQPARKAAILRKMEQYARGAPVDIRKMVGNPYYRIRVGRDRVIVDDLGTVIMVIDAGPRGSIY
jgi:mRNA interferase RelE/StbE